MRFGVVIPTRNRSAKLEKCLHALTIAREQFPFSVDVSDSSEREQRELTQQLCATFDGVGYTAHDGQNVAAARNACARASDADILINVDDDVYVDPEAISRLANAFANASGPRVVAGSVNWDGQWSAPGRLRAHGYSRALRGNETPSFVIGAFFAYPRAYATAWPWNERIKTSDDRFMGAVWRSHGVALMFEPTARAFHDDQRVDYGVLTQKEHIYTNLFDALIANPDPARALTYEVGGFLAGLRAFVPRGQLVPFLGAWLAGHRALVSDAPYLREIVAQPVPRSPEHVDAGLR